MGETHTSSLVNIEQTLPPHCWHRACDLYRRSRHGQMHRGRWLDFFHFYVAGVADAHNIKAELLSIYVADAVDSGKAPNIKLDEVNLTGELERLLEEMPLEVAETVS